MLKNVKWLSLLSGLAFLLIGLYILANPVANLVGLGLIFGITMIFSGISDIVNYFSYDKERRSPWFLVNGIITILLALWLLSGSTTDVALIIPTIFAFWILSSSIARLLDALSLKKTILANTSVVNTMMWLGIIGIIFGIILFINPGFTGSLISYIMAFLFIYQGFNSLSIFFRLSKF